MTAQRENQISVIQSQTNSVIFMVYWHLHDNFVLIAVLVLLIKEYQLTRVFIALVELCFI